MKLSVAFVLISLLSYSYAAGHVEPMQNDVVARSPSTSVQSYSLVRRVDLEEGGAKYLRREDDEQQDLGEDDEENDVEVVDTSGGFEKRTRKAKKGKHAKRVRKVRKGSHTLIPFDDSMPNPGGVFAKISEANDSKPGKSLRKFPHGIKKGPYKGNMTFYNADGPGACGPKYAMTPEGHSVCASIILFRKFDKYAGGKHLTNNGYTGQTNPICGQKIKITHKGKTAYAVVRNEGPDLAEGSLDMSRGLFAALEDPNKGISDVQWEFVGN